MKNNQVILYFLILLIASCKSNSSKETQPDFLAKNIDTTANPADDFFEYAEGNWLKNTEIPQAEASWGIGNLVQEDIYNRLRKINEDAATEKSARGITHKIGDFWYSGMDTLSIEQQGLKPLNEDCSRSTTFIRLMI